MTAIPYQSLESQYVVEYSKMVHVLSQERTSKLMPYVRMQDFRGEDFAYDRFGVLEAQEIVERFQPIQLQDAQWDRRFMSPRYFAVAVGIDEKDIDKMLRNPSQELAESATAALMRVRDQIIYAAATATVLTGKSPAATTPVTFANDGGVTIDATGGFGFSTLQSIKKNFVDSAVAVDTEVDIMLTIDGQRELNLLGEVELTSFDYATEKPVAKGSLGQAYGIQLVSFASNPQTYTPLLQIQGGQRTLISCAENAIVFAKGVMSARIEKRIDMFNTPTQMVFEMAVAALRTEGVRVQAITVSG